MEYLTSVMRFESLSKMTTFHLHSLLTETTLNHIGSILLHENVKELIVPRCLLDWQLQTLGKYLFQQQNIETLSLLAPALLQRNTDRTPLKETPKGEVPSDEVLCEMTNRLFNYLGMSVLSSLDEIFAVRPNLLPLSLSLTRHLNTGSRFVCFSLRECCENQTDGNDSQA
jgi:hypothetical protein